MRAGAVLLALFLSPAFADEAAVKTFPSYKAATSAFVAAISANDEAAHTGVIGAKAQDLLTSGNAVQDDNARKSFLARYHEAHTFVRENPDKVLLTVGKSAWELPFPIVKAVEGADCVIADTWVSMGDSDHDERIEALEPYQVDERLMRLADRNAAFLHCLPAHRGEEVTDEVIDGPASLVWDEAENRIHAQKSILAWCFGAIG